jgi:hypothetical protein
MARGSPPHFRGLRTVSITQPQKDIALRLILLTVLALVGTLLGLSATAATVSLAGFSYSGDYQSIQSRFPYTKCYSEALAAEKSSPDRLLAQAVAGVKIDNFTLKQGELAELKGSDQAIAVSMVMTSETVSYEQIGRAYKVFINLRGQVLFFDFKSMSVLRAYPVTVAYLDVLATPPSDEMIDERVRKMFNGDGSKEGLFQRFANQLSAATLPANVPRFLQVNKVSIAPEARAEFPEALKSTPNTAETWLADQLSEMISSNTGTPVLPYAKGYAIGNTMAMRFADGTVFNLKIPEADYAISIDLTQFKRVKTGESVAGTNFVYGSFITIKLVEPVSNRSYLEASLKNGESKQVPAAQTETDDFPAYSNSVRGMFRKLTQVLAGKDDPWIKSAASGADLSSQISATKTILQSCK